MTENEEKTSGKRERILGIDLGTTNSAAAIMEAGRPMIIPSAEGPTVAGKMFPSVIAFTKEGQLLVGESAKRQAITNPEGTVREIKRKMGTDYTEKIYGKEYSPQQLSAFILQKILRDTEKYLGEKITKAVITVPAHFNDNQRQATKDAGEIAGLEVTRIVNEPTAAAMAYGLDKLEERMKILVFSFGGGTNDTTIMDFGEGVFQVLSTSGDTLVGGADIDNTLVDYFVNEFRKDNGIDLTTDKMAMARLKEASERAKIELSTLVTTEINLPFIASDSSGPKHLNYTLTRAKLEQLALPIIQKIEKPIKRSIQDAGLTVNDIDKVILIGGQTKMPRVQSFVEETLNKPPESGIDPMECVAIGAAVQGAVLAGEISSLVLLDVTPLSLGVETLGSVFTKIIERNTTIPVKRTETFTTAADFQTAVTIHVLQGERSMAKDNVSLGMFNLTGIPPAPRGIPQIEVTYDIDADGMLHVSAKDKGTGKEAKITITASTKLSDSEKDRMMREAEQFEEQDKKAREEAETRNSADSMIYTAEKTLKELDDKFTTEQKDSVKNAIEDLRKALAEKELDEIKAKLEVLSKVIQEAGASVYQQAAQQQASQQQQAAPKQESESEEKSNVVDAEYRVVDEEKK
jgi:molecular chaperone DnaK